MSENAGAARPPFALVAYSDPQALARALAAHVGQALLARLARDETAALAVSGGRTPARFLETLSGAPLDWRRVSVTLVDDRWVPETSLRSNAALVRRHLLRGPAAAARFVPLYTGAASPEAGLEEAEARVAALSAPFAAVVLGMGEDGHTASFFPRSQGLAAAIDPAATARLAAIRAQGAGEPRITVTLPALIGADTLVLHIEGMAKRETLEAAAAPGAVEDMPIRAVLRNAPHPLDVLWCP